MSSIPSKRSRKSGNIKKSLVISTRGKSLTRRFRGKPRVGEKIPGVKLSCIPIPGCDTSRFTNRMSPASIQISQETQWIIKGYVPSFEATDRILMEATRRTYKILGIPNQ